MTGPMTDDEMRNAVRTLARELVEARTMTVSLTPVAFAAEVDEVVRRAGDALREEVLRRAKVDAVMVKWCAEFADEEAGR